MKHQSHPSGSNFGPRSRPPLKVWNGSMRKWIPKSERMKKIYEEVKKSHANMQPILGRKRKHLGGPNEVYGRNSDISPPTIAYDKLHKSNNNAKEQRGNNVSPQAKQHGGKFGHGNTDAMKGKLPQMAMSPKPGHASSLKKSVKPTLTRLIYKKNASKYVEISKVKQGLVLHANDIKMSISQLNDLKAMRGLLRNSKGQLKLGRGPSTEMHSRDWLNGCGVKTKDDNVSRKEPLLEGKHKSHDENGSELENATSQMMTKCRKYIDTYEAKDDNFDQSPKNVAVAEDNTRLPLKDDILKYCHAKASMPFVGDRLQKECHCCSKPIDENVWSGLLKIGDKEYIPLDGHLSTKSCEKVHNLSKSLSHVVEVAKFPRSKVWPKRWEGSTPTHDNIGLYFFPYKLRPDKYHDQLLKEVMENDLALRAIIGDVEMLMFPSSLLPERYQTFQLKHYLWAIFKPREFEAKQGAALRHPDQTTRYTALAADATVTVAPGTPVAATVAASISTEDTAANVPANHGQATSRAAAGIGGAPSGRMVAFVVRQTPRLEQLIREIDQDGALVMHGEMMSDGSWPGNLASVMQRGRPSKS